MTLLSRTNGFVRFCNNNYFLGYRYYWNAIMEPSPSSAVTVIIKNCTLGWVGSSLSCHSYFGQIVDWMKVSRIGFQLTSHKNYVPVETL